MRAKDEFTRQDSCMNRAKPFEMVFVLLGRDKAAPVAIRAWCTERIRTGKNKGTDREIIEALLCAQTMEDENL